MSNPDRATASNLPSFERHTSPFTRVIDVPLRQRLWSTSSNLPSAVQPLHRRQTEFSSFRRQLLEQSSVKHDIMQCTLARDIQTAY